MSYARCGGGRKRRRAFSSKGSMLIEVLLGMSLLLIAIMAIFALFPVGDRAVANADRSTQAHQLARRMIDTELAKTYENLVPGIPLEQSVTLEHSSRQGTVLKTTFHTRLTIISLEPAQELKRVFVEVRWERGTGIHNLSPAVELESLKGRFL